MAPEKAFFARVGRRIREVRLARGLSQNQVAEAIRSYQQNVARTERGTENLTLDIIFRIAVALDVDPVVFFEDGTSLKTATPKKKTTVKQSKQTG